MIPATTLNLSKRAGLKIKADTEQLTIRHNFRLKDKSMWGMLLFLLGGIFLIIFPLIQTSDSASKVIGVVIGIFFVCLSILTLIRETVDRLSINSRNILFRYNLKPSSFLLDSSMRVRMKTDIRKIRRTGSLGSDFIIITYYLQTSENEIPIFSFQMEYSEEKEAKAIGNEITRLLNEKIRDAAFK